MVNKLKSNRGATMILALALFLICVMVSSIILVVAASGSTRVSQQVEEQQNYLSVSSAADVVATELDRCNKYVIKGDAENLSSSDLSGVFGTLVRKAAFQAYKLNSEYTDTINIEFLSADTRLENVVCSFTMKTDYNIEIIVKTTSGNYSIVIRSKANVGDLNETTTDGSGNEVVVTTKTISWDAPNITKGVGN